MTILSRDQTPASDTREGNKTICSFADRLIDPRQQYSSSQTMISINAQEALVTANIQFAEREMFVFKTLFYVLMK